MLITNDETVRIDHILPPSIVLFKTNVQKTGQESHSLPTPVTYNTLHPRFTTTKAGPKSPLNCNNTSPIYAHAHPPAPPPPSPPPVSQPPRRRQLRPLIYSSSLSNGASPASTTPMRPPNSSLSFTFKRPRFPAEPPSSAAWRRPSSRAFPPSTKITTPTLN